MATAKFKVVINSGGSRMFTPNNKPVKNWKYYWADIVSTNGQIVFAGETRKSKSGLIKTVKNLFGASVKIIDKTGR